jgi:hypothetical protein
MSFDEPSEGAAYLSALKRSGSPQAAGAATARAPETAPPSHTEIAPTNKLAIAEKRKSARYKCKGSARLQEGSGITTWATFADVSLSGCYIETPSPFRRGTALALRLELNGLRVEAMGEVRVAYPNLGMGIRFLRMSDENREQLRELVGSISRSSGILGAEHTPSLPMPNALRAVTNPHAILQSLLTFFEDRHMMSREEFLGILRKNQ